MDLALTTTWNPRGELERFMRILPELEQKYKDIVIVLPPEAVVSRTELNVIEKVKRIPGLRVFQTVDWAAGRYTALRRALDTPANHIIYIDLDRLLHWYEIRPEEWQIVADRGIEADCLIFGRSALAYQTHPRALVMTELISNAVVSYFLGRKVDVSAGCKGFSRRAVEFLMANTTPQRALGTDAEWPILLHRAGFRIDYFEVEGLDWESADRYRQNAADGLSQRLLAQDYDADPEHWAQRVEVALEIIQVALEIQGRPI